MKIKSCNNFVSSQSVNPLIIKTKGYKTNSIQNNVPNNFHCSFGAYISPEEIKARQEITKQAQEKFNKLPVSSQYLLNPEDKKVTEKTFQSAPPSLLANGDSFAKDFEREYLEYSFYLDTVGGKILEKFDTNSIYRLLDNCKYIKNDFYRTNLILDIYDKAEDCSIKSNMVTYIKDISSQEKRKEIAEKSLDTNNFSRLVNNVKYVDDEDFRRRALDSAYEYEHDSDHPYRMDVLKNIKYHPDKDVREKYVRKSFNQCYLDEKTVAVDSAKYIGKPEVTDEIILSAFNSDKSSLKEVAVRNFDSITDEKLLAECCKKAAKSNDSGIVAALVSNSKVIKDPKLRESLITKSFYSEDADKMVASLKNLQYISKQKDREKFVYKTLDLMNKSDGFSKKHFYPLNKKIDLTNALMSTLSLFNDKPEVQEKILNQAFSSKIYSRSSKKIYKRIRDTKNDNLIKEVIINRFPKELTCVEHNEILKSLNSLNQDSDENYEFASNILNKYLVADDSRLTSLALKNLDFLPTPDKQDILKLFIYSSDVDIQDAVFSSFAKDFPEDLDIYTQQNLKKTEQHQKEHSKEDVDRNLYFLNLTNQSGSKLDSVFREYDKFKKLAIDNKDKFAQGGQSFSDGEMESIISECKPYIQSGIVIAGRDVFDVKFEQKECKFVDFINSFSNIILNPEISADLHDVLALPADNKGTKLKNYEKANFIKLIGDLLENQQTDAAEKMLYRVKNEKVLDLNKLYKSLLIELFNPYDFFELDPKKINDKVIDKFEISKIPTLINAMNSIDGVDKDRLKSLLKTVVNNNYSEYIFKKGTDIGDANIETKELFKENNLDFDKWMNYDKSHKFKHNGKDFEIKLWGRNPAHDLFLGNYGNGCIALDGVNKKGIIDGMTSTFVQFAEIIDNDLDKTVGYIRYYWAKDKETGKNILVTDNIHYKDDYSDKNAFELVSDSKEFAKDYAKAVSGEESPVYMAACSHIAEDSDEERNIEVIGSTPDDTYYLNSITQSGWCYITGEATLSGYQI